jgi:hypothetical protein
MIRALILVTLLISAANAWPMEDPEGDVDGTTPTPGSGADLRTLTVEEGETHLHFSLETETWRDVNIIGVDGVIIWISFQYGNASYAYRVDLGDLALAGARSVQVNLKADVEGFGTGRQYSYHNPESENGLVSWSTLKSKIFDENGAPLVAGRHLSGFSAESRQRSILFPLTDAISFGSDRMPDEGTLDLPITVGPVQSDILQIASNNPFRWSNGGATTFAFEVELFNRDNATVSFHTEGLPEQWQVYAPKPTSGGGESVTVYLTVPDRHNHGGDESFILVATGPAEARLELGVHYPEIPMPAGHHPTLYFHQTGGPSPGSLAGILAENGATLMGTGQMVMNTLEIYEPATDDPSMAKDAFSDTQEDYWVWPVLLEPNLRTGLNITAGPAPIEFTTTASIAQSGIMRGELLFFGKGSTVSWGLGKITAPLLASFEVPHTIGETINTEWSNWQDLDTNYNGRAGMGMNLIFFPEIAPGTPVRTTATPQIISGSMTLPLGEYHDSVTIPLTAAQEAEAETLGDEEPEVKETPFLPVAIVALLVSFQRRLRN